MLGSPSRCRRSAVLRGWLGRVRHPGRGIDCPRDYRYGTATCWHIDRGIGWWGRRPCRCSWRGSSGLRGMALATGRRASHPEPGSREPAAGAALRDPALDRLARHGPRTGDGCPNRRVLLRSAISWSIRHRCRNPWSPRRRRLDPHRYRLSPPGFSAGDGFFATAAAPHNRDDLLGAYSLGILALAGAAVLRLWVGDESPLARQALLLFGHLDAQRAGTRAVPGSHRQRPTPCPWANCSRRRRRMSS